MFVSRIPQGLGDPQIRLCEEGDDAPHYAILALSGAQVCVARDEELPDALLHAGQRLLKVASAQRLKEGLTLVREKSPLN